MNIVNLTNKISGWVQWVVMALCLAVTGLLFLGGDTENSPFAGTQLWDPKYLPEFLYWMYTMFILTLGALLIFGLIQFVYSLRTKPKAALMSLGMLVIFVMLFVITYAIGDDTPLKLQGDVQDYNTPFWLKMTDMFIYSMTILFVLCALAVASGALMKFRK